MRIYLRTLAYFRRDWPRIALLLVLIGVSVGVGLLQAWPTAVLIDSVLTPTPHYGWVHRLFLAPLPRSMLGRVIGITLIGMGLKVAQDGLTLVKNLVNRQVEFDGLIRVRCALFGHLQTLGPDYHKRQPQGDALYRITSDASCFKDVLNTLVNTGVSGVRLIVMLSIMLSRSLPLTVVALAVIPGLVYINRHFGPRLRKSSADSKQQETDYTTVLQRSMSVVGLVQAFCRERREFGQFKAANRRCARGWMRVQRTAEAYSFSVNTLFSLGGALIFGFGGYLVYRDQFVLHRAAGVTVGDVMVFMSYLGDLWNPLRDITSFTANIAPPMAAVERVLTVLDRPATVGRDPSKPRLPRRPRELSFEHVAFGYDPAKPVLHGVSAHISPGQMVAFVGSSGAGKSTLLNLIGRAYDPTAGRVLLDGMDVRDFRLADVRRHIAVVSQDCQVMPATVAANIAFGRTAATVEDVRAAAELAGAHEFIDRLPMGYDTPVTEGGQNLSGGQRQRLAVARAVLSDAPILVLDEPTSALDPEHTRGVIDALHGLRRHRTVVLVTHHLASVAGCDQIFVMDHGRLVERGTHAELLARGGLYANMVDAEAGGLAVEPTKRLHVAA